MARRGSRGSRKREKPPAAGRGRRPQGEIHLADLVRALDDLPWQDESHTRAIAGCLGFGLNAPDLSPSKPAAAIHDRTRHLPRPSSEPTAPARPSFRAPPPPLIPVPLPRETLPSALRDLGHVTEMPQGEPAWLAEDFETLIEESLPPPRRHTLLPANNARGILSAALATLREGDELDVRALITRAASGQLPARLPRRPDAALSAGCHLLLDFAESMTPWWEDLHDLRAQIVAVVGRDAVADYEFDADPAGATRWLPAHDDPVPWAPAPGVPVVAASDLGIRGRTAGREAEAIWKTFAGRCERAGSPLVILIPWPPRDWPRFLGRYPTVMHWNPRTTAAMVRQVIGPGHRVRR